MSTPPQPRRSGNETSKKVSSSQSAVVTRNGARKAKIQTRAMAAGAKPSSAVLAAKRNAQQKKKQNIDTVIKDQYQLAMESQNKVRGATGVVTHPIMTEHRCLWDDNYPECPERLISVLDRCKELGLLDRCVHIEPRAITEEELEQLHSPAVYEMMEQTHQNQDVKLLEDVSSRFDAVFIHPTTHEAALLSAGSTIELVERVLSGELHNGFALVRPPGHHAMRAEPCGYCVYNNVALAARRALDTGLTRVLIVDWDVHHGQATQQMFYDDPRVVYFSVHRYEHGSFWPNLRQSNFNYVGSGPGTGYNFNVPLNATGMGDADYLAIWYQLLLPMAFEFRPELVLVSAGYDAAVGCPEFRPQLVLVSAGFDSALGDEKGEMRVSPCGFAWLTQLVSCVSERVCVVLEGGYCLPSLAEGAALTLRTLLGHAPPPLAAHTLPPPCPQIVESILNCIYAHKPYWECYKYQPVYSISCPVPNVNQQGRDKHTVRVLWEGDETRPDRYLTRDCYPVQDKKVKNDNLALLNHLKEVTVLSDVTAVGFVYDEHMLLHTNIFEPGHVECPERIMRIHKRLQEFGLLERLQRVKARPATDEEILTVHTKQQLDQLKELSSTSLPQLKAKKETFESVYFHPESLTSARYALGGVLEAVDSVLRGEVRSCVCAVRPPGHHAGATPSGFCLLNNAAAGALRAVTVAPRAPPAPRVLVLDWDVHHGDGTQHVLYNNSQVLYMSLHRYDNGTFFPHSTRADYLATGEGPGEGYNVNIPWNKRGMGDAEYLAAFAQVVMPVGTEFAPDLVIVSAGFDACIGDPLGGCKVTPECFGQMTNLLRTLAGGRLVLVLEGGYNVTATSYAMTMCTKALLGDPVPFGPPSSPPAPSAIDSIKDVIQVHRKYWKSLAFWVALPEENVLGTPEKSRGLLEDESEEVLKEIVHELKEKSLEEQLTNLSLRNNKEPGASSKIVEVSASSSKSVELGASSSKSVKSGPTTLSEYLSENLSALQNEEMFAVVPLAGCPHVGEVPPGPPPPGAFLPGTRCGGCDEDFEVWVCLLCYYAGCGRSVRGHGGGHHADSGHPLALSLCDLSVWCYPCDAYVDHPALHTARNHAHTHKFGEPLPYTYTRDTIHMY